MVEKRFTQLSIEIQFTFAWRSGDAFASIRHFTTSVCPFSEAFIKAVHPFCNKKRNDMKVWIFF